MIEDSLDAYHYIGVGTVCKRVVRDEIPEVAEIVRTAFPDKYIHLSEASLMIYKDRRFGGLFDSSDTAAWNWGVTGGLEGNKQALLDYRRRVDEYREKFVGQSEW